jgi:hypothetical protein
MSESERLIAAQKAVVSQLECEMLEHISDGNEYYAEEIRNKVLPAAKSLARLIHKAKVIT